MVRQFGPEIMPLLGAIPLHERAVKAFVLQEADERLDELLLQRCRVTALALNIN